MRLGITFPIKDKKFGVRLKSLMNYNGMTEADLAVKCAVLVPSLHSMIQTTIKVLPLQKEYSKSFKN